MDQILIFSVVPGCIVFDVLSFICARDVMRDFLRGAIGKKQGKKTWSSMSFLEKLSLKKLKALSADESGLFMRYYTFYKVFLYSLASKYPVILFAAVLQNTLGKVVSLIIGITVLSLSFAIFLVFRIPQLPEGTTDFIHYRRNRRK